jgi:hypothetical protein
MFADTCMVISKQHACNRMLSSQPATLQQWLGLLGVGVKVGGRTCSGLLQVLRGGAG